MKRIFILILVFSSLISLTSCKKNIIKYKIIYDDLGGFGYKEINEELQFGTFTLIKTYGDLITLCNEWNNPSFDKTSEYYDSEISKVYRSLNEEFFLTNYLIIYSFERGHLYATKIKNVTIDGDILKVNVKKVKTTNDDVTTEAFSWLILISVENENLSNISDIKLNYIN